MADTQKVERCGKAHKLMGDTLRCECGSVKQPQGLKLKYRTWRSYKNKGAAGSATPQRKHTIWWYLEQSAAKRGGKR